MNSLPTGVFLGSVREQTLQNLVFCLFFNALSQSFELIKKRLIQSNIFYTGQNPTLDTGISVLLFFCPRVTLSVIIKVTKVILNLKKKWP